MALEAFPLRDHFGDPAGEARACRDDCALFDFSFLECARLEGRRARPVIEAFTGRSLHALAVKQILYALRVGPAGNAIADLTVWRTAAETFEVMSGRREDVVDLLSQTGPGVDVRDISSGRATFALQGPGTLEALRKLADVRSIEPLKYFGFGPADLAGIPCTIGRLGYTGEAGVEIIVARAGARELWQALCRHARPAGSIAMDILRIEAGFVLFTNEFRLGATPKEVGLDRFHRHADRPDEPMRLVSFRAEADGLSWPWRPSPGLERPQPGTIAVTSACPSIVAGGILGLGYTLEGADVGNVLREPTGTVRDIRVTALPFYDTAKRRPRSGWR